MDPTALGRYLRESRESRELTLEDAVRSLRIRRDILESFEQGEFNVMDSTVQVRGMLRNYAHFLGLDEERVLQYYESANSRKSRRRFIGSNSSTEPVAPRRITDTPPTLPAVTIPPAPQPSDLANMLRNVAMVLVSLAAIAVIIFVMVDRFDLTMQPQPTAFVTAPVGALSQTPTNTPTITPRATVITDTPNPALGISGVQVEIVLGQRSWVRVSVDDIQQYAGFLEPGYIANYTANTTIEITAANAAALDVTFNGIPQETFGARGQEVTLIFSATGIEVTQSDIQIQATATTVIAEPTQATATSAESSASQQQVIITPTGDVANAQNAVTNTPVISGIITPTPLFGNTTADQPTTASTANTSINNTQPSATTQTENDVSDTATPQPTISPTVTNTPTSSAVLPLRQTPANPTATKSS